MKAPRGKQTQLRLVPPPSPSRPRRMAPIVAVLLLVPAGAAWLLRPNPVDPVVAAAVEPPRPVPLTPASEPAPESTRDEAAPAEEVPLMQAGSEDSSEHGPRRPHPMTPTRARIYGENNLIGAMNQAMDLGRYDELRALNAQYREGYPEDEHVLQQAYDLIADCQEDLTDERQARAREFWKRHRSSQLRRFVRRHCRL